MSRPARTGGDSAAIRCSACLLQPAGTTAGWSFLVLPRGASSKLPSRGPVAVEGSLNGASFRARLEPDGQGSHWLKVSRRLREAAGAEAGLVVELVISPSTRALPLRVPQDLRQALADSPRARLTWSDLTPAARRDWVHWVVSAKGRETRARRIRNACDMLASGKRRVCCFDRSGVYSKALRAPRAVAAARG